MWIGYARVSTDDQDTTIQEAELRKVGCERIYKEKASGGRWDRPELHRALEQLRPGDVLMVWKLDRLTRSLKDLVHLIDRIEKAGAGFRSIKEVIIDTTTPAGRMMTQILAVFGEFEREMTRERTRAGLDAARQKGRIGGRRSKLNQEQKEEARRMVASGEKSAADVARLFNVHPSTISRLLAMSA
jgi:DNA invertase Pin-like site-specific DNA recombinase